MAIGFWKFVLVTSVLIAFLRGGSNFLGNAASAFPFSIFMWICYRVARLQPWWPFPVGEEGSWGEIASRFGALKRGIETLAVPTESTLPSVKPSVLTAEDLRRMVQYTTPARPQKIKNTLPVKSVNLSATSKLRSSQPPVDLSPLTSKVGISNVGIRSKAVRSKTSRQKTVRSKRKPSFT